MLEVSKDIDKTRRVCMRHKIGTGTTKMGNFKEEKRRNYTNEILLHSLFAPGSILLTRGE